MSRKLALVLLAVIILSGVGLRAYHLTARSIWFDETFSWRLIQFPFTEMLARDAADVHPPLYYIMLRGWTTVFATSLLSLRSFSVMFAATTIGAAYIFAAYGWNSRGIGIGAAALVAFSGWQSAFAWEARMYTLGTTLALLSSWLLLKAVRTKKVGIWVTYALVAAAFAYVHYYAFFTIAAQVIWLGARILIQTRGRILEMAQLPTTRYALLAGILMLALYAPWIPTFIDQNTQVQTAYWIPTIGGWSIPDTFYRMIVPTAEIPAHAGGGMLLTLLPGIATLILLLWLGSFGKPRDAAWLTLAAGTVPFLLSIGISLVSQSLYQDRFFVFAHLFLLVGYAVVIMHIPKRLIRGIVIATTLVGFLAAYQHYWQELDINNKPGIQAAINEVMVQRTASEPIIVGSPFIFFGVDHYLQEQFSSIATPHLYSETESFAHFAGGPILTKQDIVGPEALKQKTTTALWVIDTTGFGASETQLPPEWRRIQRSSFPEVFDYQGEVVISRYERSN